MRWNLLLMLTFGTLSALPARGDFVPGRVRASAEAQFSHAQGEGRYRGAQLVHLVQFQTDGKGITKFTIQIDHAPPFALAVTEIKKHPCGRTFLAKAERENKISTLRINELNSPSCNRSWPIEWQVTLETGETSKEVSRLSLRGEAEYFYLSQ